MKGANPVKMRGLDLRLQVLMGCLFLLVSLPFIALFFMAAGAFDGSLWAHLLKTILFSTIGTTLYLLFGVGILVTLIGVSTAWLVTMCDFAGRRIFAVLLLLPLALPTYVSAFAYIEFLGFTGPLQTFIRDLFGYTSVKQYWFPDYRTTNGAIVIMSLVLYPYVYLTSRASFTMQTASTFDACRTLGAKPWRLFKEIGLPMARPGIIIGVALALMEAANDIGAVEFFGVRTLTTTIYDVWLNRSSLSTAAQIALFFLAIITFLLWMERRARREQRLYSSTGKMVGFQPFKLKGRKAVFAIAACGLPVFLGFVVPVIVLAESAIAYGFDGGLAELIKPARTSVFLSLVAMVVTVGAGFLFAYASSLRLSGIWEFLVRLTTLGYAVPGVILAIGVLVPLAAFDNAVDSVARSLFDFKTGLLLSGTSIALIFAYSIRFLPMAFGSSDAGFQRLSPNYAHAARTLGRTQSTTLKQVYLPLMKPALITGGILVFVDCMKELPATLLLRPFNTDTLATRIYDAASLEIFEMGALPALTIIVVGLVPVILLSVQQK